MVKIECKIVKIKDIKPYENNPRKNKKAVGVVTKSIKDYGFKVPLVLDENNVIICGHTRYMAAQKLGLKEVPCIMADDLDEEQVRAFRLADNQVAEFSTWDEDKLAMEIESLGIDLSEYGFGIAKALQASEEINVDDFDDDKFKYECPCCGFRFN
jgi:ParB/RepB/Spo0J family partition protein